MDKHKEEYQPIKKGKQFVEFIAKSVATGTPVNIRTEKSTIVVTCNLKTILPKSKPALSAQEDLFHNRLFSADDYFLEKQLTDTIYQNQVLVEMNNKLILVKSPVEQKLDILTIKHYWCISPATEEFILIGYYSEENIDTVSRFYPKQQRLEDVGALYASDVFYCSVELYLVLTNKNKVLIVKNGTINQSSEELTHLAKQRISGPTSDSIFGKVFCATRTSVYFITVENEDNPNVNQQLVRVDRNTAREEMCLGYAGTACVSTCEDYVYLSSQDFCLSQFQETKTKRLKMLRQAKYEAKQHMNYMVCTPEFIVGSSMEITKSSGSKPPQLKKGDCYLLAFTTRLKKVSEVLVGKLFPITGINVVRLKGVSFVLVLDFMSMLSVYACIYGKLTKMLDPIKPHWGVAYNIRTLQQLHINHDSNKGGTSENEIDFLIHGDYRCLISFCLKVQD